MLKYNKIIPLSLLASAVGCIACSAYATTAGYDESNFERFQPDYFGRGVHVGSFTVKPLMMLDARYDDNIYLTETGTKSDKIAVAKPAITAESNWGQHALNFQLSGEMARYAKEDDENYNDYLAGASGRLDILRGLYMDGGLQHLSSHENRGLPDNTSGVEPNKFTQTAATLSLTKDVTRVRATIGGEARNTNYQDNHTASGAVIDNDVRNRNQYSTFVRLGYQASPGYEVFGKTAFNKISYDSPPPGASRDSQGYTANIGLDIGISGKLTASVYAGYLSQSYDNSIFSDVTGVDYGGSLSWEATGLTHVQARALRSVNETTLSGASSYLQTALGVKVDHELTRSVMLQGKVNYTTNDYQGVNRQDTFWDIGGGARYFLNQNFAIKSDYTYGIRNSSAARSDYKDNRVDVGLIVGM